MNCYFSGRQGNLNQYHVQFFGDEGERGWVNENAVIPFEGRAAFEKFCENMIAIHKKDRQNYIVGARRLKAWNIAVAYAEEAFPMTRVFRVHHYAFVYDSPSLTKDPATLGNVSGENPVPVGDVVKPKRKYVRKSLLNVDSSSPSREGLPTKRRKLDSDSMPLSPSSTGSTMTSLTVECENSRTLATADEASNQNRAFSNEALTPDASNQTSLPQGTN